MNAPKDKTIVKLLERLQPEKRGWIVLDDWDADLCAIGIATAEQPDRRVYISTFNRGPGVYYFECESPMGKSGESRVTTHRCDNAGFAELLQALESYLR